MDISIQQAIDILARTPEVIALLLRNLSDDWIKLTEGGDTWSPYDVVGHLLHGEQTDWLARIEIILSNEEERKFKPFDRFAQFENSKGKSIDELINEFAIARANNLQKISLLNITLEDMDKTGIHPAFGSVTLSQLIATWVVHDLDHLAQISRILASRHKETVGPWVAYLRILKQ